MPFRKKFQAHPPKPTEAEPSFRKVRLPTAKLHYGLEWNPKICSYTQRHAIKK